MYATTAAERRRLIISPPLRIHITGLAKRNHEDDDDVLRELPWNQVAAATAASDRLTHPLDHDASQRHTKRKLSELEDNDDDDDEENREHRRRRLPWKEEEPKSPLTPPAVCHTIVPLSPLSIVIKRV
jgi:hypothetical protein